MHLKTRTSLSGSIASTHQLTRREDGTSRVYIRVGQEHYTHNQDGSFPDRTGSAKAMQTSMTCWNCSGVFSVRYCLRLQATHLGCAMAAIPWSTVANVLSGTRRKPATSSGGKYSTPHTVLASVPGVHRQLS